MSKNTMIVETHLLSVVTYVYTLYYQILDYGSNRPPSNWKGMKIDSGGRTE